MPKGVPNKRYTPEFKKTVVETMMKEKLSYRETARQFEVSSDTRIRVWERIYLVEGSEGLAIERPCHGRIVAVLLQGAARRPCQRSRSDRQAEHFGVHRFFNVRAEGAPFQKSAPRPRSDRIGYADDHHHKATNLTGLLRASTALCLPCGVYARRRCRALSRSLLFVTRSQDRFPSPSDKNSVGE